ncbi:hypothetical protein MKW98_028426, partial [Papaver atlanticum]
EAAGSLHQAGAIAVMKSTPVLLEDAELNTYKIKLLQRFTTPSQISTKTCQS